MKKANLLAMGFILSLSFANPLLAQDSSAESNASDVSENVGGVKSLEDRINELEEAMKRTEPEGRWFERIRISGLIEVEAGYGRIDFKDPAAEGEDTSDVDLATVELNADANIADHVDGHIMIKYEDDDLLIDEGFVTLSGPESFPAYLIAGRQYIPFGNYESQFITDPNTLILGETNQGAVVAGYRGGGEMLDIAIGAFNGRTKESEDDDVIDSFVASIKANPIDGLSVGVSYTSNLAGSDSFNEEVVDPDNLGSLIGAWSAFITYEFLERFVLTGEYVGAVDSFEFGEIYDAGDTQQRRPSAWNVEFGATVIDELSAALRYGGSDDGNSTFLPETQYGVVINWALFQNTNLALEYLYGDFEDDYQDTDTVTAQLAVEF